MTSAPDVLATGLCFGEGPRWHDGELWLSDMHDGAVVSIALDGNLTRRLEVPGLPSGLGWLPDGSMLVVSMTDRRVLRAHDGAVVEHADLGDIATFHCNDMVVATDGTAYVGNFGFDLHTSSATRDRSMIRTADLAMVRPDGRVERAATDLAFPNGTVISPDGRTLVVAESMGARLTAFDIADDGSLSGRRVWAELPGVAPDGICLDADGAIWVANARAAECLRVAEGGRILERIESEQLCFACMLGGPDGTTLFMLTAPTSDPEQAAAARAARVVVTQVASPHAGRP